MGCSWMCGYIVTNPRKAARQRVFIFAVLLAVPNGILAALLKEYQSDWMEEILQMSPSVFGSFTFLIGLFVAFRASQAYARFWDGTSANFQMVADFFDVCSSLFAFCRKSKADQKTVEDFQHTLVRLFSLMHALILADLAGAGEIQGDEAAYQYTIIDPKGLDQASMIALRDSENKVDLVFNWIQSLMVENLSAGVISVPPPICTRAFQELNAGMVQFHKALQIAEVPFPFPYTAATEVVLLLHWCLTVVVAPQWCYSPYATFVLAFMQVFMLWSLNCIAIELENPFGGDMNDLDVEKHHLDFNQRLMMLCHSRSKRTPRLSGDEVRDFSRLTARGSRMTAQTSSEACKSLHKCFQALQDVQATSHPPSEMCLPISAPAAPAPAAPTAVLDSKSLETELGKVGKSLEAFSEKLDHDTSDRQELLHKVLGDLHSLVRETRTIGGSDDFPKEWQENIVVEGDGTGTTQANRGWQAICAPCQTQGGRGDGVENKPIVKMQIANSKPVLSDI